MQYRVDAQLLRIRDDVLGGTSDDRPAVCGPTNAVTAGLAFDTFGNGQESGGGVAVGNNGRINVVGSTNPTAGGYPVTGGGRLADFSAYAVRSELDMVPAAPITLPGVARTDGTGFQGNGVTFPVAGFTGGTTPTCGLDPFGRCIGAAVPILQHMLIDYEGDVPVPSVSNAAIICSRPTVFGSTITTGVLELGLPPTTPFVILGGADVWLGGGTFVTFSSVGTAAFRIPLVPFLSTGGVTMSAQVVCLLDPTLTPVSLAPSCSSAWTASPAIWFSF